MHVAVIREGKEPHQGVGYLDDGTMIVVENGRRLIGETVDVVVTSVLQTAAGRMIFAARSMQEATVRSQRRDLGAAIVAAGRGNAFGRPKQLIELGGKPMLAGRRVFAAMPEIDRYGRRDRSASSSRRCSELAQPLRRFKRRRRRRAARPARRASACA